LSQSIQGATPVFFYRFAVSKAAAETGTEMSAFREPNKRAFLVSSAGSVSNSQKEYVDLYRILELNEIFLNYRTI
jgi:hypothetical protein